MTRGQKANLQAVPYRDCGEEITYPQGLKWTRQRKNVYRVLLEAREPLSAIQIYDRTRAQDEGEEYAVSTIYRILAAFEEKDVAEKAAWPGENAEKGHATARYQLKRGAHVHYAVCLECHRRMALKNCPFAHMSLERETEDFTITDHRLELYGYCKKCREAKNM